MPNAQNPRMGWKTAVAAFVALATLRLLAADFRYFFEQDEMSLANGIASIMEGHTAYLYHYGPQLGYYRLMALLAGWAGGIAWIPIVMSASSAVAGAVIPTATLFAFRHELSDRLRLLAAAVVTCSPVLWISSQYGNTAVLSAAAGVLGLVILSNKPAARGMAAALALCAGAVLLRADAVVLAPIVALLVYRSSGSLRSAATTLALGAVGVGVVGLLLVAFDPLMTSAGRDVVEHFGDEELRSLFWEHGLWAFSPLVLVFALLGAEELAEQTRTTVWSLVTWAAPVGVFYFGATTTPRYFLLAVVPVAILAAAGIERVVGRARHRRVAWVVCLSLAFAHLWVGLGHFSSSDWTTMLTAPTYETHDGPMPTGALVYQGYHRGDGVLGPSLRRTGPWGTQSYIANAVDPLLERVRQRPASSSPGRILVLLDHWSGHVFQFHALKAGATIVGRDPGPEFMAPTRYLLGATPITTVGIPMGQFDAHRVELSVGDEVWHFLHHSPFPRAAVVAKLGAGLGLEGPVAGVNAGMETYTVVPGIPN